MVTTMPDEWFAEGLSIAHIQAAGYDVAGMVEPHAEYEAAIDHLFSNNGVPFVWDEGVLRRSGDAVVTQASVQPAISVLDDPRLAEARKDFRLALADMREGDHNGAVDNARQAIEATMLALIEATNTARPRKNQAQDLFNSLRDAKVLDSAVEHLVLGETRLRNKTKAGHAGKRDVESTETEAAIASAAASILYLGKILP